MKIFLVLIALSLAACAHPQVQNDCGKVLYEDADGQFTEQRNGRWVCEERVPWKK